MFIICYRRAVGGGHRATFGSLCCALLLPYKFQELNSLHQAWQQVLSPTESHQPVGTTSLGVVCEAKGVSNVSGLQGHLFQVKFLEPTWLLTTICHSISKAILSKTWCVYVYVCMHTCTWGYHSPYVEIRGQLVGVSSPSTMWA